MSKDPAFLFYDGDAARDVSHMNRIERGCYFDLIQAQRKFGSYSTEQARKILGHDFESCWGAIELILQKEGDKYFIEWVRESIENRKGYAEKQRKRIQDYWDKKKEEKEKKETKPIPRNNGGISTDIPYEEENEEENENEIVNKTEIEELYNSVVIFFDKDCWPKDEKQKKEWRDTLDKLIRIDKHSPDQIKNIIKRARMDDFWKTNFLSVLKLRKKNKEGIPYFTVFEKKLINNQNGKNRVYSANEYTSDRI